MRKLFSLSLLAVFFATSPSFASEPPNLKNSYTTFGIMGSVFAWKVRNGDWDHLEGGVNYFKTNKGEVWFSHFEADTRPLDVRKVYLVRVSADKKIGCGESLHDYEPAPAKCVVEERILSWANAKQFLRAQIHDGDRVMNTLEVDYRARYK